jgi:primosomal protein N''
MNDNESNPARLIYAIEILLAQLDASLSPELSEVDTRTDFLKKRISGFKDQTARLKSVLQKHQAAERRKRALSKQNRRNTSRPKFG